MDVFDTLQTVYTQLVDEEEASRNAKQTYSVESGNEFSVLCVSSGEFNGRVTWVKNGTQGKLLLVVFANCFKLQSPCICSSKLLVP